MRSKMIKEEARIAIFVIIAGSLLSLWPSTATATIYEYDALNRLTRVVYDEGTVIEYTYDAVGNRTRRISTLMADTTVNGTVDFEDYAVLASRWLDNECYYPDWCERADIDWSTEVNWNDVGLLAQQWLQDIRP